MRSLFNKLSKSNLSWSEKFFSFLELVFIIFYFVFTIIELFLVFSINTEISINKKKYFYYSVQNRINPLRYTALLETFSQNHVNLNGCPSIEERLSILQLDSINGVSLVDVTNSVKIYESWIYKDEKGRHKNALFNQSVSNEYKFFHFNISQEGDKSINLRNRYKFTSWKDNSFCVLKLEIYDYNAFHFVDPETNCKSYFGHTYYIDCGVYFNETYKICLQTNLLKLNSTHFLSQITDDKNRNDKSSEDPNMYCPFNYFSIDFKYNDKYDANNISSTQYVINMTLFDKNNATDTKLLDNYLLIDIDNVYFEKRQIINDTEDEFVFQSPDLYFDYNIGKQFGFTDPFSKLLDNINFSDFYNNTYYKSPVYDNSSISYLPMYMFGEDETQLYLPLDETNNKTKVYLNMYTYKLPGKECYNKALKNTNPAFFKLVRSLSIDFTNETLNTIIAWLFVKLFISIYWQIIIRIYIILGKLNILKLNDADIDSEYVTKITAKACEIIMFLIIFYGIFYHKFKFEAMIVNSNLLIENECFKEKIIIESLNKYKEFIEKLINTNNLIFYFLFSSMGMELILALYYLYENYIEKKFKDKLE